MCAASFNPQCPAIHRSGTSGSLAKQKPAGCIPQWGFGSCTILAARRTICGCMFPFLHYSFTAREVVTVSNCPAVTGPPRMPISVCGPSRLSSNALRAVSTKPKERPGPWTTSLKKAKAEDSHKFHFSYLFFLSKLYCKHEDFVCHHHPLPPRHLHHGSCNHL